MNNLQICLYPYSFVYFVLHAFQAVSINTRAFYGTVLIYGVLSFESSTSSSSDEADDSPDIELSDHIYSNDSGSHIGSVDPGLRGALEISRIFFYLIRF